MRGIKISTEEYIQVMGIDLSQMDEKYKNNACEIDSYVCYNASDSKKLNDLNLEVTTIRSFFDGKEAGEIIIGKPLSHGYDGEVAEVEEPNDEEIKTSLSLAGFEDVTNLRTYMQYISNDNY